ncbi:MAG: CPBP family intramembrane metalloprotease [Candidatus Heimdallarchaeota archaeon]|nr:MAG: CPBP family intramembrane metalloprotease [Candidatus Heimdallarchaeota archaeon]
MKKFSVQDLWIRVVLFFLICVILIYSLQVFILPLTRQLFNNGNPFPETFEINIVRGMNGIVGIGLVYVFLNFDRQKLENVGLVWDQKFGWEWFIIGIPIAIIGLIPTVLVELLFGIVTFGEILDPVGILLTLVITILAIGLGEEIIFRGYLQTILETRNSFYFSTIVSAFLFGLLHFWLWAPAGNLLNMVTILFSAFAIGLTFSYVFKTTKYNLILPVAIHGFWDFFLFIFQAEFTYEKYTLIGDIRIYYQVFMEIFASFVGAAVIFLIVYLYSKKRLITPVEED